MAANQRRVPASDGAGPPAPFPETQTAVLLRAAGGDWQPFFDQYLAPCWREIVLACRGRVPPDQAADLLQELALRLMRDGRARHLPGDDDAGPPRGNIPLRFLARRDAGTNSARFRTYLKGVICNLIDEHARRERREARVPDPADAALLRRSVEDTVSTCIDRGWVGACLTEAAARFRDECRASRTRGRRRLFDILYLAVVPGLAPAAIADRLGLDRTTVAGQLGDARKRFVALLGELSGVTDPEELKGHVTADPARLFEALERARNSGGDAGL